METRNLKTEQKAKVNYNTEDTWLEPYIGHIQPVKKLNKTSIYVLFNYGTSIECIRCDKKYFDLIEN